LGAPFTMQGFRHKFHDLSLTLPFQYGLTKHFSLELGPELTYLLANKQLYDEGGEYYDDAMKRFSMGAIAGIQYQLNARFAIAADYHYGFTALDDANSLYNRSAELVVRFTLPKY
jgi:hypothetical protein